VNDTAALSHVRRAFLDDKHVVAAGCLRLDEAPPTCRYTAITPRICS
jgi:hypothetical protein